MDPPHTLPHLTTSRNQNGVHHSHPDSTMIQHLTTARWWPCNHLVIGPFESSSGQLFRPLVYHLHAVTSHVRSTCRRTLQMPGKSKNLYIYISVFSIKHFTTIGPDKCLLPIGNARHTPLHAHDRTGAWTSRVVDEWLVWPHGM